MNEYALKTGISKEGSKALQGLAILMMLYHHLFSTPEALGIDYVSLLNFNGINVELHMAWFFKICVGIYAFVSGYGMLRAFESKRTRADSFTHSLLYDLKTVLYKLFSFYKVFWAVFIIFVPIGFVFFNKSFELKEFILNFFGLSNSYNGAWWYILQYLKMMLLLPFIDVAFKKYENKKDKTVRILYILIALAAALSLYLINKDLFYEILSFFQPAFLLCFIAGYIISRFKIYEFMGRILNPTVLNILAFLAFFAVIVVRVKLAKDASSAGLDFIFVPLFSYGFLSMISFSRPIERFFEFFGTYSTIMWLVHVFYYDHYAKKIVMMSGYSATIYLTLLIMSLLTAIAYRLVLLRFQKK